MNLMRNFFISFFLLTSSAYAGEVINIVLPHETVGFEEPVQITKGDMYSDGGTIFIVLTDARGKDFSFCLDGRLKSLTPWQSLAGQKPKRHLYVNATHPTIAGAEELSAGGQEERALLQLIKRVINNKYSQEQQQKILANPTDETNKDRWALRLIEVLEGR